MNIKKTISRRNLLAGLGGTAALLPLFDQSRALGDSFQFPKRFIAIQTTNGTVHEQFWPAVTDETAFTLDTPILSPLAPYKDDVIVLGGLDMTVANDDVKRIPPAGGIGHHNLPHLLTGAYGAPGRIRDGRVDPVGNAISIDQHIAQAISQKTPTPFRSLELGILTAALINGLGDNANYISFNGPALGDAVRARPDGNSPEENPYKVFDKLFTGGSALTPDELTRLRADRKSAIDFVTRDLGRLKRSLGKEAKQKLDAHLTGVRRVEAELDAAVGRNSDAPMCKPVAVEANPRIPLKAASSMPVIAKAQIDLLVAAMACDLTRVSTIMFSNHSNENLSLPWLGIDGPPTLAGYKVLDHHNVTHNMAMHAAQKTQAENWFISQFAYLIGALKAVPEGKGTMLDNTLVLWANNMDDGAKHTCTGMPWLLAGRCGGAIRTGRYLRYGDWATVSPFKGGKTYVPHNQLLAAIAVAMDAPVESFGSPEYPGVLPRLLA